MALNSKARILPSLNRSTVANGRVKAQSPAEFLAANPRALATATITIAGSFTNTDVIYARFRAGALDAKVSATMGGSESATTAAAKLAAEINASAVLRDAGLAAQSAAGVVTITGNGPVIQSLELDSWAESAAGITVQMGGTVTSGEYDVVRFVGEDLPGGQVVIDVAASGTTTQRATAMKNAINANAALVAAGVSATSSTSTVTIGLGSTNFDIAVTAYAWQPAKTATIGGTPAEGDEPVLTVTNAALPGGDTALTYTVLDGDDAADVAAAFAELINENAELIAAGITATALSNVVTIVVPKTIGAVTYAKTDDNTTITLSSAPTESYTPGGGATETAAVVAFSGGSGPVIPYKDFTYMHNGVPRNYKSGVPEVVNAKELADLLRDKQPIA